MFQELIEKNLNQMDIFIGFASGLIDTPIETDMQSCTAMLSPLESSVINNVNEIESLDIEKLRKAADNIKELLKSFSTD
jgi:hypothetical protein